MIAYALARWPCGSIDYQLAIGALMAHLLTLARATKALYAFPFSHSLFPVLGVSALWPFSRTVPHRPTPFPESGNSPDSGKLANYFKTIPSSPSRASKVLSMATVSALVALPVLAFSSSLLLIPPETLAATALFMAGALPLVTGFFSAALLGAFFTRHVWT